MARMLAMASRKFDGQGRPCIQSSNFRLRRGKTNPRMRKAQRVWEKSNLRRDLIKEG